MPGGSAIGRTLWPQTNLGLLLPRYGVVHPAQRWLGVLPAPWTASVYRGAVLPRLLRRQLRRLQFVAAGAIRDHGPRDRVCVYHFVRTLYRCGGEFRRGRASQPQGNSRRAGCVHRDRLRHRPTRHSLRSGNPRPNAAGLGSKNPQLGEIGELYVVKQLLSWWAPIAKKLSGPAMECGQTVIRPDLKSIGEGGKSCSPFGG